MTRPKTEAKYPLYVVSKGRADTRLTVKALERMGVPFHIVIEEQEHDSYAAVIDPKKILHLPYRYKEEYDCFDDLGLTKSTGAGPARNYAWDHSIERGYKRHWVMDDNILKFYRYQKNRIIQVHNGAAFRAMEDFCDRYLNVALAGPQYETFVHRKQGNYKPFAANTRIYSCSLILNSLPLRWRGRHNEDTDISLRVLKAGWCTIQFNAFLQGKLATQMLSGGNTEEFYKHDGRVKTTEMLCRMHPDVAKPVMRYNRLHHHVDYRPFRGNRLVKRPDFTEPDGPDEYGMRLRRL